MATIKKSDVVDALKEQGIEFDPAAKVATLQGLLPADHPLADATVAATPAPKVDADRQARWDGFLASAREVNPERFDRQKENGEFNTIPDSFK